MQDEKTITLNEQNIDSEHICCAIGNDAENLLYQIKNICFQKGKFITNELMTEEKFTDYLKNWDINLLITR